MAAALLRLERLSKQFPARLAVDDLSLDVGPGEIYGLIGPNGSGKTTTIKTLGSVVAAATLGRQLYARTLPVIAKLGLYSVLPTLVVVPIAMAGTLRLVRDPALAGAAAGLLVMLAVTTTTLALALGAAWPDFREPNPEFLATSAGGLATTLVSLVYVALVGWIARNIALGGGALAWLLAAASISAALAGGSLALAYRRIRTLETA